MKTLENALRIADIHADRLEWAANALSSYFPMKAIKLESLSYEDTMKLDFYTNRFARLQDQLGQKVFPLVIKCLEGIDEQISFNDILYKLDKWEIIKDADQWAELRKIRNDISHEYPDDKEKMAEALNKSYEMRHLLLNCLKRIHAIIIKSY